MALPDELEAAAAAAADRRERAMQTSRFDRGERIVAKGGPEAEAFSLWQHLYIQPVYSSSIQIGREWLLGGSRVLCLFLAIALALSLLGAADALNSGCDCGYPYYISEKHP